MARKKPQFKVPAGFAVSNYPGDGTEKALPKKKPAKKVKANTSKPATKPKKAAKAKTVKKPAKKAKK